MSNLNYKSSLTAPHIAIVVPVYCEAANIPRLHQRLEKVAASISNVRWEYIFVNDGSTDSSLEALRHLAKQDPKIKVIDFSRNFGKEVALSAGVHAAFADAVICLDADLQHPPELIPQLIEEWRKGTEVVIALRESTQSKPMLRKIGSFIFYWFMSRVSGLDMVPHSTDFRLLDKKVVDALRSISERERLFRGLVDWLGFKKGYVKFRASARELGTTTYSYSKLLRLALQSLTSFSLFPLRMTGYLGFYITLLSGMLLSYMILTRFHLLPGFFTPIAFVAVGNTLLIGIVLMGIGLVALYIGTIHTEVVGRPLYVVRERINFSAKETGDLE